MIDFYEDSTGGSSEKRFAFLSIAIILSAAVHIILAWSVSNCSFAAYEGDFKTERKWSRDVPKMSVERMPGDPLAPNINARGRPLAAPVTEDTSKRMTRLAVSVAESSHPSDPAFRIETKNETVPAPEVPKIQENAWKPRQEIVAIENPVVPDDAAAMPRRVISKTARIVNAADVTPPQDLAVPSSATLSKAAVREVAPPKIAEVPLPEPDVLPVGAGFGAGNIDGGDPFHLGERAVAQAPRKVESVAPPKVEMPRVKEPVLEAAHVDVKKVIQAKEEVRALRDNVTGLPFEENVKTDLAYWIDPQHPQFKYFRVRVSSQAANPLPVVPKDVVYLLDASGSIANDRLKVCREAVRAELRKLNSDDRFNVVAFRDKFSYAFTEWQKVEAYSVGEADRWLSRLTAHGRTDVFATLRSVLAVPRDPRRPLIALFITDGEATSGLTKSAEILSRFEELNGGLISVYMYGVKRDANDYLMDMLARGNRGGWARHNGMRWNAANGIPSLCDAFADPVLADVSVAFTASSRAEVYPRLVTNLYRAEPIEIWGICPADQTEVVFEMRGLNADKVYENVFKLSFDPAKQLTETARTEWAKRRIYAMIGAYTVKPTAAAMAEMRAFARDYGVELPYVTEMGR